MAFILLVALLCHYRGSGADHVGKFHTTHEQITVRLQVIERKNKMEKHIFVFKFFKGFSTHTRPVLLPHHQPAAAEPPHSVSLWGWWNGMTAAPESPPHPWASTFPATPEPAWPPGADPSSHTWGTLSGPAVRGGGIIEHVYRRSSSSRWGGIVGSYT